MEQLAPVNLDDLEPSNQDFLQYVKAEIAEFLNTNKDQSDVIMLFPPFNGYKRMLVHNLVESAFSTMSTFSIGAEPRRRIVICGSSMRKYVLGDDSADKTPKTSSANRPRTRPTLPSDVLKVISRNLTPLDPDKIKSPNIEGKIDKTSRTDSRKTAENQRKSADRPRKSRMTMSYYVPPHMRKTSFSESEPVLKKEKIDGEVDASMEAADEANEGLPTDISFEQVNAKPIDESLASLSVYQQAPSVLEPCQPKSSLEPDTLDCESDSIVDQPDISGNADIPPSNPDCKVVTTSSGICADVLESPAAQDGSGACRMSTTGDEVEPAAIVTEESPKPKAAPDVPEKEWDPLYCGKGTCTYLNLLIPILDRSEMGDIEAEVGRVRIVEVKGPPQRVDSSESPDDDTHYVNGSIVEIYDLPDDMRTEELARELEVYVDRGLRLRWVDRNTALGIFASSRTAEEVLSDEFQSRLKIRPISQGGRLSQEIARHIVLPSSFRPKTCSTIAKRLLSGALGLKVSPEEMAAARMERIAQRNSRDQRKKTET